MFLLLLSCFFITISFSDKLSNLKVHDEAEWTVAVYMNGDNNLEYCVTGGIWKPRQLDAPGEPRYPRIKDKLFGNRRINWKDEFIIKGDFHNELANPGSSSNIHVVALVDRVPGYSHNMDNWTETRLYYINEGDYPDNTRGTYWVNENMTEMNMGNPATVLWFMKTIHKYFPAKHYYLSMWDHNWGWHDGNFELDLTNDGDTISYGDLYDELRGGGHDIHKVDVIGYDACVSAQIEVLHTWSMFANQFAGSQDYIGWDGVNYTSVLNFMNEPQSPSPEQIAVSVANSMMTDPNVGCASAVDISCPDFWYLVESIDNLGSYLQEHVNSLRQRLITVRQKSAQVPSDSVDDENHKDLYSIAEGLLNEFSDKPAIQVMSEKIMYYVNQTVTYNNINETLTSCSGANGITIYWTPSGQIPTVDYYRLSFSRNEPYTFGAPNWGQFLKYF